MLTEYVKAIILGIVEGITEWLPISSTGHLILLEPFVALNIGSGELQELYLSAFEVVIQLGAVLAVLVTYRRSLVPTTPAVRRLWLKLALATLPAAIAGIACDEICKAVLGVGIDTLLFRPRVVATALIVYGLLFILIELGSKKEKLADSDVSYKKAFAIGCFQSLAIIPGTSRSGATILGARMLKTDKRQAAEFSFFAAIPVIFAASALKLAQLFKFSTDTQTALPAGAISLLLVASAVAFAVSMVSIRFLTDFIKRHSFALFGVYRIILGTLVLIFFRS